MIEIESRKDLGLDVFFEGESVISEIFTAHVSDHDDTEEHFSPLPADEATIELKRHFI